MDPMPAPNRSPPPPPRRRAGRLLWLAYLPYLAWSLIGTVWTMAHHRFTFVFAGALLALAGLWFAFKRRFGIVTVMCAVAGGHALGAFSLHAWLRLPLWMSALFFLVSLVLLVIQTVRVADSRGS
jgi:hypothetical protein